MGRCVTRQRAENTRQREQWEGKDKKTRKINNQLGMKDAEDLYAERERVR